MARHTRVNYQMAVAAFTLFALVGIGHFAAEPVIANPVPESAIFTHVQEYDPDFCTTCPITECEQITQYTPLTGQLDFDLFYTPLMMIPEPFEYVSLTAAWPPEWSFVEADLCCDPNGTITVTPGGAELTVQPDQTADQFFLIARITLDVPTTGDFEIPSAGAAIPGYPGIYAEGIRARAGVECGNCVISCDYEDQCLPRVDPPVLELVVEQGGTTQATFHGWGASFVIYCDVQFTEEEDWMTLEIEEILQGDYNVTVIADAAGLQPGTYVGWVEASTWECYDCVKVVLRVQDCSATSETTWGSIKDLYQ